MNGGSGRLFATVDKVFRKLYSILVKLEPTSSLGELQFVRFREKHSYEIHLLPRQQQMISDWRSRAPVLPAECFVPRTLGELFGMLYKLMIGRLTPSLGQLLDGEH
jgi:hypothetical protein